MLKAAWKLFAHYLDPRSSLALLLITLFACAKFIRFITCLFSIPLNEEIYWAAVIGFIGYMANKFLEVRTKRFNALCNLEVELNHALGLLSDLKITVDNMLANQMPILRSQHALEINDDTVKSLGRLDVKNNVINLLCDFRKINHDWNLLVDFGEEHKDVLCDPQNARHQSCKQLGFALLQPLKSKIIETLSLTKETALLIRFYTKTDVPVLRFKQPYVSDKKIKDGIEKDRKNFESELSDS